MGCMALHHAASTASFTELAISLSDFVSDSSNLERRRPERYGSRLRISEVQMVLGCLRPRFGIDV